MNSNLSNRGFRTKQSSLNEEDKAQLVPLRFHRSFRHRNSKGPKRKKMCPKVRFLVTLQKRRDFFALPFVLIHIALLHRACNPTCLFCNKKKGQKRGVTMGSRVRRLLPQSHGALVRTSKRVCWRRVESAKSRRHRHGEHKEVQRRAFTFLSREEGVAHIMSF